MKITPYLLCSASKHSAVKLLAAAAKSISIISVFCCPNRGKLVCSLEQNNVIFANTFGCTINYIDSRANRHGAFVKGMLFSAGLRLSVLFLNFFVSICL